MGGFFFLLFHLTSYLDVIDYIGFLGGVLVYLGFLCLHGGGFELAGLGLDWVGDCRW
jgi:hypothetical protein